MSNPVPTLIKGLHGTLQPCRAVENEPEPAGSPSLEPPAWMNEFQRVSWRETLANCPSDLLRGVDTAVLVQYVIALDLYTKAAQEINEVGYTSRGYKGIRTVHPAVHVMNSQSVILRQCIQELGFSPASRTRINMLADVGASDEAGSDHWAQISMTYT
jgi:P27 family predicted phage terminase small subunit